MDYALGVVADWPADVVAYIEKCFVDPEGN